jgi:hypothetical protein
LIDHKESDQAYSDNVIMVHLYAIERWMQ